MNLQSSFVDSEKHKDLLILQSAELTDKTPFCPGDQEMAEYFDCQLSDQDRQKMEHHLVECRYCLARVGMLGRLEQGRDEKRVPGSVLAAAKQLTPAPAANPLARMKIWATAAVLVLALSLVVNTWLNRATNPNDGTSGEYSQSNGARVLRSTDPLALEPDLIITTRNPFLSAGTLIQWTDVPDKLHYEIFVMNRAGDVLWTERLEDNLWVLPDDLPLAETDELYVRVDASLKNGRTLRSKHTLLNTTEHQ